MGDALVYADRDFRLTYTEFGERVGVFIRRRQGAAMTADDLKEYCRGKISRYKTPKHIHFLDRFPMTASGKTQKYKLRELARELWPEAMA